MSKFSQGSKYTTKLEFKHCIRGTIESINRDWFEMERYPTVLIYISGKGGNASDSKDAYLKFFDGDITYEELFKTMMESLAQLSHNIHPHMGILDFILYIDADYSGNAAEYLESPGLSP